MPGIADKFTQSAQSRLLWPGMTWKGSVPLPERQYVQPELRPYDPEQQHGLEDQRDRGRNRVNISQRSPRNMGPRRSPDDARLIQIDIEFVGAVAADQRQFERGTCGVRARRQTVKLEGEALDPGWAVFEQFRNR